jgi:cell division protein FtsQ
MRRYRKPYRIKQKKSIFRNRFFWFGILGLVVSGGIFYLLVFSALFQIEKVTVFNNKKIPKERIQDIVKENLERKIIFFKSKSIFLIDLKKIKENVLNNFPSIAEIEINRRFPNTLNLKVTERKEVGIFCYQEACFLLDKEGIIFENVPKEIPLLKIQKLNIDKEMKLGERMIEKELIQPILEVETKLRDYIPLAAPDFKITEFSIISEERINAKTSEGWEIYFNPQRDINWQLTKLKALLENEIPAEKRKDLEYIELRFGNSAPYKYRQ